MASLNIVHLMGNLGKDVELRSTQSGTAVGGFSIATTETRVDNQGNKQENTEWHNIVVWGKQAENCAKYLSKGSKVFIEGSIKNETYMKDDEKRYTTKIVARNVQFLTSKSSQAPHEATDQPQGHVDEFQF